jgi:hypothetical protein
VYYTRIFCMAVKFFKIQKGQSVKNIQQF